MSILSLSFDSNYKGEAMSDFCISLISTFLGVLAAAALGVLINYLSNKHQSKKTARTALTFVQANLQDFMNLWESAVVLAESGTPALPSITPDIPEGTVYDIYKYDPSKGEVVRQFKNWIGTYSGVVKSVQQSSEQSDWENAYAKVISLNTHFTKAYASIKNYTIK